MKNHRIPILLLSLTLCLVAVAAMLVVVELPARAVASTYYVSSDGDCGAASPCYATIQDAVDAASDGDTVKVKGTAPSNSIREKIILAMGNVLGVSKVEEALSVEKSEPDNTFYTVKKGDTLWKIAEAHYGKGNGAKYNVIFEANRPMLKDPDKIYPGQVLRIPPL